MKKLKLLDTKELTKPIWLIKGQSFIHHFYPSVPYIYNIAEVGECTITVRWFDEEWNRATYFHCQAQQSFESMEWIAINHSDKVHYEL